MAKLQILLILTRFPFFSVQKERSCSGSGRSGGEV